MRISYDTSGETYIKSVRTNYPAKVSDDGLSLMSTGPIDMELCRREQNFEMNKYLVISIYRIGDETLVHSYRESTEGPHSHGMVKTFVVVCGVTWFIGMLNYAVKYFVNCETGENYTAPIDRYNTWHYIASTSPSGKYIIVETYTFGGNEDIKRIYDLSNITTVGPVETYLLNVPDVFNERMCEMEFVDDDYVKLFYYNEYDDNKRNDIGVFKLK
jgi:uncharacterized protein YegJ (DUF2314 family)